METLFDITSRVAEKISEPELIRLLLDIEEQVNGFSKKEISKIVRDLVVMDHHCIDGG